MTTNFKCGICLVFPSLTEGDYFVNTQCGHIYHFECIREWIRADKRPNCPICRESIDTNGLVKLHGISPLDIGCSRKYAFKFVIIGDSGTGKTSLLHSFAKGIFPEGETSTVGCDLCFKTLDVAGRVIKLSLWDCGGQDRFMAITPNYLRNVNGVVITYDVTKTGSLESLNKWLELVYSYAPTDVSTILIGNKIDRDGDREIPTSRGKELAEELGFLFIETSAKDLLNVEAAFRMLTGSVLESYWRDGQIDSIELSSENFSHSSNKSKCKC